VAGEATMALRRGQKANVTFNQQKLLTAKYSYLKVGARTSIGMCSAKGVGTEPWAGATRCLLTSIADYNIAASWSQRGALSITRTVSEHAHTVEQQHAVQRAAHTLGWSGGAGMRAGEGRISLSCAYIPHEHTS
jgi:hypothetical protein